LDILYLNLFTHLQDKYLKRINSYLDQKPIEIEYIAARVIRVNSGLDVPLIFAMISSQKALYSIGNNGKEICPSNWYKITPKIYLENLSVGEKNVQTLFDFITNASLA